MIRGTRRHLASCFDLTKYDDAFVDDALDALFILSCKNSIFIRRLYKHGEKETYKCVLVVLRSRGRGGRRGECKLELAASMS